MRVFSSFLGSETLRSVFSLSFATVAFGGLAALALAFLLWSEDYNELLVPNLEFMPPKKWDRRFHRRTETRGREVMLIDKVSGQRGTWACLAPGGGR